MTESRLDGRRVAAGVLLATALALVARFALLDLRLFHWDEGRVGYWILRYLETGVYVYRPIVHGPFLFHVNRYLFALVGPSDFAARAVVALVGGLLPLAAWLYREHLTPVETVVLAFAFALNPVLLYFSRFMRNDVLVGAFALFALGFYVRALDTRRAAYLYPGTVLLALAFTAKENALLYVLCWLGALALVADHRAVQRHWGWVGDAGRRADGGMDRAADWTGALLALLRERPPGWRADAGRHVVAGFDDLANGPVGRYVPLAVAQAGFFLFVVVLFFAPRPDLWVALSHPARLPAVVAAGSVGAWGDFFATWVAGHGGHSYFDYLLFELTTAWEATLPLSVLAVVGFLYDRYGRDHPTDFVAFCGYWGFASVLGYPAVTDIQAPWMLVHSVLPLAVPAAVAVGVVVDRGAAALRRGDRAPAAVAVLVLIALTGQVAFTAASAAYLQPQDEDNPLVQFGQPGGYMGDTLAEVAAVARANEGTDVLFYGEHFYVSGGFGEPSFGHEPQHWLWRMPLPWYLERADATTNSTLSPEAVARSDAPVVVTLAKNYPAVAPALDGYEATTYELTATDTAVVFFVREDAPRAGSGRSRGSPDHGRIAAAASGPP